MKADGPRSMNHRQSVFIRVHPRLILFFAALLLSAQPQPRTAPDSRILETRYELAYPWWDGTRGIPLPASKTFGNSSGELRLLNTSGAVETNGHAFFTPLGSNGRACVTCHQPTSAMSL